MSTPRMSTLSAPQQRIVETWGGRVKLHVEVLGTGPALVYLHPAGGLDWDDFLLALAQTHTIYAPRFPGTAAGDSFAIHELDDIFDVVLAYEGALRSLGVEGAPAIGQSFGGMLTAELASAFPSLFSKVVLLDPAGLWNEDHPWTLDFMEAQPQDVPGLMFHDPSTPRATAMFTPHADPQAALEGAVTAIWTLGCVAKFLWPVPDRGLAKRLHRLTAPTLVMWGEQDQLIPVAYAQEYARLVPHAVVQVVPECGHIPQVEQLETTLAAVTAFLA